MLEKKSSLLPSSDSYLLFRPMNKLDLHVVYITVSYRILKGAFDKIHNMALYKKDKIKLLERYMFIAQYFI